VFGKLNVVDPLNCCCRRKENRLIYDIYLLQLGFHLVATIGRLYKNTKETAIYKWRNSTQNNEKTQSTQNKNKHAKNI